MAKSNIHSKIITAKARETLRPAGIFQKGRSRFWYDDKGWYTVSIEFVPHKWLKGTYLTLGITWLWYPKPYWSYDLRDSRQSEFIEFQSEEQFTLDVSSLMQQALEMVDAINTACSTFNGAYKYAANSSYAGKDPWVNLHVGILAILSGKLKKGIDIIKSVESLDVKAEFEEKRQIYCRTALEKAQDLNQFRLWIEENISLDRKMKKLTDWEKAYLPEK